MEGGVKNNVELLRENLCTAKRATSANAGRVGRAVADRSDGLPVASHATAVLGEFRKDRTKRG